MKHLDDISELYELISKGTENIGSYQKSIQLRKIGLDLILSGQGFTKVAFDTRRIDQETEYNPRRNLQNYNRSESFLSEGLSQKLHNLSKLRKVLGVLKQQYGKEYEWQDSNARVLLSTLDKGLRTDQLDGDYTDAQPAMGSLDYIEELLHVRYRLTHDDLHKLAESDLKKVILSKDEELIRQDINEDLEISKRDISNQTYDSLMNKLFDGCRATKENRHVQRSVTITIKDDYLDDEVEDK